MISGHVAPLWRRRVVRVAEHCVPAKAAYCANGSNVRHAETAACPDRWDGMHAEAMNGGYQIVSVALPTELIEHLLRRVGPHGLSGYVAQALMRQEPMAALVDFHCATAAAMGLRPQLMA